MEPVTHFLTGACIGRTGLNRRTAYATLAAVLAAEAPDIDTLWSVAGPVSNLAHHRGITHTFLAAPFMALAVTGVVWLVKRLSPSRKRAIVPPQPVNWLWVYLSALIADLSHLALDWTNNYGVRPFFPFNKHWYSGDIVFIAEPVLWALLVLALVIPALLGLTDRELGARRTQFRGRGWAIFALSGMVAVWGLRWSQNTPKPSNLLNQASDHRHPPPPAASPLEPYPFSPFRWHALHRNRNQPGKPPKLTPVTAIRSKVRPPQQLDPPQASPGHPAIDRPRPQQSRLGQVYLDWSQWPVVRDIGPQAAPRPRRHQPFPRTGRVDQDGPRSSSATCASPTAYLDTSMGTGSSSNQLARQDFRQRTGLAGWVYIVDNPNGAREEAGQFIGWSENRK